MEKMRRVLLLSMGLALMALIGLCVAAAAPQDPAASATLTAATGQPSCGCEDKSSCSCACSPLAGAWVAKLSKAEDDKAVATAGGKPSGGSSENGWDNKDKAKCLLQTYKFAPVNDKCDRFVVNAQTVTRPEEVIKAFPEVTDLTEFVGIACKSKSDEVDFTAISYGIERTDKSDKRIFIAVVSGTVELPKDWDYSKAGDYSGKDQEYYKCKCCKESCKDSKCSCKSGGYSDYDQHPGKCSCCKSSCKSSDCECKSGGYSDHKDSWDKDSWNHKECNEPKELCAELTVAYFDAEQDEDCDGFPDKGEDPVVCLRFDAKFKRVELVPQCKPSKGDKVVTAAAVQ